jgi:hypothetical protein
MILSSYTGFIKAHNRKYLPSRTVGEAPRSSVVRMCTLMNQQYHNICNRHTAKACTFLPPIINSLALQP